MVRLHENFVLAVGSVEDYTMLEKVNKVSGSKYADVKDLVENVNMSMQQLDEKCMLQLCVVMHWCCCHMMS